MSVRDNSCLAAQRREEILRVASKCFAERGFKSITMAEIARRSAMSVGNLYNYFESKDAIVAELSKREIAQLAREVDLVAKGDLSLEERRENLRQTLVRKMHPARARVMLGIFEEATLNENLATILAASDKEVRTLIAKMRGTENPTPEEAIALELELALVDGIMLRLVANPDLDVEAVAERLSSLVVEELGPRRAA